MAAEIIDCGDFLYWACDDCRSSYVIVPKYTKGLGKSQMVEPLGRKWARQRAMRGAEAHDRRFHHAVGNQGQ